MIQKIESSKYTIKVAHADISAHDLKEDCVGIGAYIKKRMLKNCDVENFVNLKQEDISPALYSELQCCQPTTAAVERSFSMLGKLLRKDRPFSLENVGKILCVRTTTNIDVIFVNTIMLFIFLVKICKKMLFFRSKSFSF